MQRSALSIPVLFLAAGLAACGEEAVEAPADPIRTIKWYEITEPAGGQQRAYSGTLKASDTSSLSFAVPGTVATVTANTGDTVTADQVLAALDTEPFRLRVSAAQADLDGAQSTYTEKQADVARQRELFQKGWVAQAALDQAVSAAEGSEAQLNLARSQLAIAERDLRNATLIAPFAGRIASRDVEPFQEVNAGQSLFLLNATGALEVDIAVPDTVVGRLNQGRTVTVDVSAAAGCGCTARITEIGSDLGVGNTVTVTAALLDGPSGLLPGMAAQVRVPLGTTADTPGFLVPLTAVAAGDEAARGYLFVFDRATGTVRRTPIDGGEGLRGNLVPVQGGLNAGDIVAAAGVSFLRDGQHVRLLGE